MVLISGKALAEKEFELNEDKIVLEVSKPSKLEVQLMRWSTGIFEIGLILSDSDKIHIIKSCKTEEEAREAYEKVLERLESGNYTLHIYREEVKLD